MINEVFDDGNTVVVEYSAGPEAYTARWEGRPPTPPFQWGMDGAMGPSDMEWLENLDPKGSGMDKFVNPDLVAVNPGAMDADLKQTMDVLYECVI